MKRSRFTEEQIIGMLKEQDVALPPAEIRCKHGVSQATFHKYKAKFGGMGVSDARKPKALEDRIAKFKKPLAKQMMDVSTSKEMLGDNF
jgi:putative transposase